MARRFWRTFAEKALGLRAKRPRWDSDMASRLLGRTREFLKQLRSLARQASRPRTGVITGFVLDRLRSRAELEPENALLRK